jgi:hypothetical protein
LKRLIEGERKSLLVFGTPHIDLVANEASGLNWLARKVSLLLFSVQPLCSLCLCGSLLLRKNNHRGTENTEVAQRRALYPHLSGKVA